MSMDLKSRVRVDLIKARKGRNRMETIVLSSLLSEIRNKEIELGRDLDDQDVTKVITKAVKQRKESSRLMLSGGRPELADKELEELTLLQEYLPTGLSESEIRSVVQGAIKEGFDPVEDEALNISNSVDYGSDVNGMVRSMWNKTSMQTWLKKFP